MGKASTHTHTQTNTVLLPLLRLPSTPVLDPLLPSFPQAKSSFQPPPETNAYISKEPAAAATTTPASALASLLGSTASFVIRFWWACMESPCRSQRLHPARQLRAEARSGSHSQTERSPGHFCIMEPVCCHFSQDPRVDKRHKLPRKCLCVHV